MKLPVVGILIVLLLPFAVAAAQSPSSSTLSGTMAAQAQEEMARYGEAVAITSEWAFVGEPEPRVFSRNAVFIYRHIDGEWVPSDTLAGPNAGESFGAALEVEGDQLFVGAPAAGSSGAVYVFELDEAGERWVQSNLIVTSSHDQEAGFGTALGASGDILVVGAPFEDNNNGAASVFELQGDRSWLLIDELAGTRQDGGLFGFAVAAAESRVVVGAQYSDNRAGVAYSFVRNESTGSYDLDQELIGTDVQAGHRFGRSMDAAGNRLFVGSPAYLGNVGVVYAFSFDESAGSWVETKVIGDDAPLRYFFGWSVATDGDNVIVGGVLSFRAHLYVRNENDYSLDAVFGEDETIGAWSVAVSGDTSVVGSRGLESAMIYVRTETGWELDATLRGGTYSLDRVEGRVRCLDGTAAGYPCSDVDLLSFIPIHELGTDGTRRLNDIWGWTDPVTGTEYALVGRTDGTSFVDLSDPEHPVLIGSLPATTYASTWRDIKVINDHALIVADGAGDHGMQIFDLSQLRSVTNPPVVFDSTVVYDRVGSAHNVVTNEASNHAFIVGVTGAQTVPAGFSCGPGPHIVDLTDPANPTFAGCYNPGHGRGYTHDAQCLRYEGPDSDHAGKDLCLGADEVGISVTDVTDPATPVEISLVGYPNASYTHQGWLTSDGRYFLVNDETDETGGIAPRTRTMVFDVEDLDEPVFVGEYLGPSAASDHNLYVRNHLVYEANYQAGLRILDLGSGDVTPESIEEVGFFDVYPLNDNAGYSGSWSSYPYFDSGIVIVSGIESGLFVLSPLAIPNVAREAIPERILGTALEAFPNPSNGSMSVAVTVERSADVRVELFDALGRRIHLVHDGRLAAGTQLLHVESAGLPAGTYFVRILGDGISEATAVTIRPY